MEQVTVSSKGQIAIPKNDRSILNLTEGSRLSVTKEPAWRKLAGAGAVRDLMTAFIADKRSEREREDSRS